MGPVVDASNTIIFTSHSILINTYYGTDKNRKKPFYDHFIHTTTLLSFM